MPRKHGCYEDNYVEVRLLEIDLRTYNFIIGSPYFLHTFIYV